MKRPRTTTRFRVILARLKVAWMVLKAKTYPNFVVIYDIADTGEEMYCGYKSDEREAIGWFNILNDDDADVHNAYLCVMVKQVRPYGWGEQKSSDGVQS